MKMLRNVFVVCAALILASAAMAQGGGGRGQGRRGFGGNDFASLLGRSDVQAELKLTDDEKTKLKDASDKINAERQGMFQPGGDMQAMMAEMQKKMPEWDKSVLGVLTEDQTKRAKGLFLQRGGNAALMNATIQKDLGFTDGQKAKLKDLQEKSMAAMMGLFQKMRDGEMTREEMQAARQTNDKTMNDEIGKILTDTQKAKIKDMSGTTFKFEDNSGGL